MTANGGDVPSPNLGIVVGAFTDRDELVGYAVLQYILHLEPVYIEPEYRAKVSWKEFQKSLESVFDKDHGGSYYTLAEDERVGKLCKRAGMVELPMKVYRRDI